MKRILFVDDEVAVLDGLRRMLHGHRQQWEMTFVASGEEALAALAAAPFDVVVTDMRMPKVDGMALLNATKERFPGVVRIVLSGHTELEVAFRAVPVAHLFLAKPCDPLVLEEAVDRACSLLALLEDETLKQRMSALTSLPSVPHVYAAVTKALADPDASLAAVGRMVEQDVALCARLMRVVNSGFFAVPGRVSGIDTAVRLLGTNMLKNLVLSAEVFGLGETCPSVGGFSIAALQQHSLLVAGIARRLLPDRYQAEDAFMAGMLHDVGMLVLATQRGTDLARTLAAARQSGRPLHVVEKEHGGPTHAHVGAYLLGLWSLPCPIVEAVAHHHDPGTVPQREFGVLGALHVANALAHELVAPPAGGTCDEAALDLAYLDAVGVTDRLDAWRAMAAEQAGAAAA